MSKRIEVTARKTVAAAFLAAFALLAAWMYGAEFARQKLVLVEPTENEINDISYKLALLQLVQAGDTDKAETLLVANLSYALQFMLSSPDGLTLESCRKLQKFEEIIKSKYLLEKYIERIDEVCRGDR